MEIEKLLDEETKICPECAETIKFKAKKCRFCQAQFDSEEVDGQVETRRAELLSKEREGKIQCHSVNTGTSTRLFSQMVRTVIIAPTVKNL